MVDRRVSEIGRANFIARKDCFLVSLLSGPRGLRDSMVGEVWALHNRLKARDTLHKALMTKNH